MNLHVLTEEGSPLKSSIKVADLVHEAETMGQRVVGVADWRSVCALPDLARACEGTDVRPVFGISLPFEGAEVALLARDQTGMGSLIALAEGADLRERHEGLVCLADVSGLLDAFDEDGVRDALSDLRGLFGEDLWVEDTGNVEALATEEGVWCVGTHVTDHLGADDEPTCEALLAIGAKRTLSDPMRPRPRGALSDAHAPHLEAEAAQVANMCQATLDVGPTPLPRSPLAGEGESPEEALRRLCEEGLRQRWGEGWESRSWPQTPETAGGRLDRELDVICPKRFADYFLVVAEYVGWARNHGISVGPGRGSAAGSLVSYALGITQVNPLSWGLSFERFLTPEREEMPDIDVDFDDPDRVVAHLRDTYGERNVARLPTRQVIGAKQALQDARKVGTLATRLRGHIRGNSTHACGVVVSAEPLSPVVDGVLQWVGKGTLKLDVLGLLTLSVTRQTLSFVDDPPRSCSPSDPAVWELLGKGRTTGVFQLGSEGMTRALVRMRPKSLSELSALLALWRPGPIRAGMVDAYIDRARGRAPVTYPDPRLAPILAETYGTIVYQEQVMAIAREVTGMTAGEADSRIRRPMAKKDAAALTERVHDWADGSTETCREHWFRAGGRRGWSRPVLREVWDDVMTFSSYAFSKSHAVSYAHVTVQQAWLKAHFPAEFCAATLQEHPRLAGAFEHEGTRILPADVDLSDVRATPEGTCVRWGLADVPGVRACDAATIVSERERGGAYLDRMDLTTRVILTGHTYEALGQAGALDSLEDELRAHVPEKADVGRDPVAV